MKRGTVILTPFPFTDLQGRQAMTKNLLDAEEDWLILVQQFIKKNFALLSCPHCGSNQILVEFYENGFTLMCEECRQFHHLRGLPHWFQPAHHPLKQWLKLVDL
jgi:hypothetical protein